MPAQHQIHNRRKGLKYDFGNGDVVIMPDVDDRMLDHERTRERILMGKIGKIQAMEERFGWDVQKYLESN